MMVIHKNGYMGGTSHPITHPPPRAFFFKFLTYMLIFDYLFYKTSAEYPVKFGCSLYFYCQKIYNAIFWINVNDVIVTSRKFLMFLLVDKDRGDEDRCIGTK